MCAEAIAIMESKERKKQEQLQAKEMRKKEREEKKRLKEIEMKWKKRKGNQFSEQRRKRRKKLKVQERDLEAAKQKRAEKKEQRKQRAAAKKSAANSAKKSTSGEKKHLQKKVTDCNPSVETTDSSQCPVCLGVYEDDLVDKILINEWVSCTNTETCGLWMYVDCRRQQLFMLYIFNFRMIHLLTELMS